jgi:hypothetical protein
MAAQMLLLWTIQSLFLLHQLLIPMAGVAGVMVHHQAPAQTVPHAPPMVAVVVGEVKLFVLLFMS